MNKQKWEIFKDLVKTSRKLCHTHEGFRVTHEIMVHFNDENKRLFFQLNPWLIDLRKKEYITKGRNLITGEIESVPQLTQMEELQ